MSYQGVLTNADGSVVDDGVYAVAFRIYDVPTEGEALWTESHPVTVVDGVFDVILGSANALDLPFDRQYWLGTTIEQDLELVPRVVLTSAPYALRAAVAESLAGGAASDGDWEFDGDDIYRLEGRVGIGTSDPTNPLVVRDDFDGNTVLRVENQDPGEWAASYLVLENSIGHASIGYHGTEHPSHAEALVLANEGPFPGGSIKFRTGSNDRLTIDAQGYVGIGTTVPAERLEVVGTARMTGFEMPTGAGGGLVLTSDNTGTGTWQPAAGADDDWVIDGDDIYHYNGTVHVVDEGYTADRLLVEIPSGGAGDFIECRKGATAEYRVDHNGYVRAGGADHDGSVNISGRTTIDDLLIVDTGFISGVYEGAIIRTECRDTDPMGPDYDTHVVHAEYEGAAPLVSSNIVGVYGDADAGGRGYGGEFHGGSRGVYARVYDSTDGDGTGVYASVYSTTGSGTGYGLRSSTTGFETNYGVHSYSASPDYSYAVFGTATGSGGNYGVFGHAATGIGDYAIYGSAPGEGDMAGFFYGDVLVLGTLSKSGGAFKIDHPLDPENKYLMHSFVESPDMMNVYNGNVVLGGGGDAWVELAEWFQALNRDFRYQLTPIGEPGPNLHIAEKISGNRFRIAGGEPGMEVSWLVTGVRQDAFAEENRIPVEVEKPDREVGMYLNPEAFGLPASMGVGYEDTRRALEASQQADE